MGTKKSKRKSWGLWAGRCPNCGSLNTRIDWRELENYRMAVLATVVAFFGESVGRYDRVCRDCKHKFTP